MDINEALDMLDLFVDKYVKLPNRGFFHRHGGTGKKAARNVLKEWSEVKTRILDRYNELDVAMPAIQRALKSLMRSESLTGNYFQHSLKTYVLAYHDALSQLEYGGDSMMSPNDYFNEFFSTKWSRQDSGEIKKVYEKKAGIQPKIQHYPSNIESYMLYRFLI